jgi:drug/metabolite transporter (DMT)-like permease
MTPRSAGILNAMAGVAAMSVNDVIIKKLSGIYPVHEIVFIRSGFALPLLYLFVLAENGGRLSVSRYRLHFLRGLMLYASFIAYNLGLAQLQLAETVALFFSAPLFIAALSARILGERVDRRIWLAIGAGFCGVVIMVRPGEGMAPLASLLPVMAAFAYSLSAVMARSLGNTESGGVMALSVTVVYILASCVTGLALSRLHAPEDSGSSVHFLLSPWIWPSVEDLGLIAVCGIISAFGFYFLGQGYRLSPANLVAPFEYTALPFSLLWGYLFFANVPDATIIMGSAIIVGSGIYTLSYMHRQPIEHPL